MIRLIAAVDDANGIARTGYTVWDIPNDLRHFRELTILHGATILMGRKTYVTIGRPLPHRRNLVATRSRKSIEGCETITDVKNFLTNAKEDIWVIGGGEIFAAALPFATEIHLTHVSGDYHCDVFFPDYKDFTLESEGEVQCQNGYEYRFNVYKRK